jgi:hypothetical protein
MLSSVDVSIKGVVTVAHNVEHRRVYSTVLPNETWPGFQSQSINQDSEIAWF